MLCLISKNVIDVEKDLWKREYHKTYDLCADCCASLMEWLNFDMAEERKD